MRNIKNCFNYNISFKHGGSTQEVSDLISEIANRSEIYVEIDEINGLSIDLWVEKPEDYTRLMESFDAQNKIMGIDSDKKYRQSILEQAKRMGIEIPPQNTSLTPDQLLIGTDYDYS